MIAAKNKGYIEIKFNHKKRIITLSEIVFRCGNCNHEEDEPFKRCPDCGKKQKGWCKK
ncbi:hypothetical protein [Methanolapillus millepedarum]|uniref:Uncharacterized protein n=1 Tax=Methanolapillus millepedarum TaxID=3028296 RepID=A0AA96ZTN3_9EURY|nr:hypothetical protein MsAc7_03250 [Methanosarcinaceae archaeon Ac7]